MDWINVISSLKAAGLSLEEIAKEVDCSVSLLRALSRKARGKRLSYDVGRKLEYLYEKYRQPDAA
ncbi:transcriptional regulator [Paludibacterium sp. dN 18-1]|uniref:Transcriptional regulator n=1 Tax=Paludibacterium denitrificans TaxID=2675226 RepID=A0A844GHN8_9NEIS|nr:transcriptional regulator [Paludibacterium denitrificans]